MTTFPSEIEYGIPNASPICFSTLVLGSRFNMPRIFGGVFYCVGTTYSIFTCLRIYNFASLNHYMKYFFALSLLALACSGDLDFGQEANFPKGCTHPTGSYTATYTETDGTCGKGYTESFDETDTRTWFPAILDLDDCDRTAECDDGVLNGSSHCTRSTAHAEGTLDGELVFDTETNTGTLHLVVSAVNYHGSSTCESNYDVTYDAE